MIINRSFHPVASVLFIACLFSGCAKYKPLSLDKFSQKSLRRSQEKTLSLSCHVFNKNDCYRYLDRDVIKAGYKPVYIVLTNNTNRNFFLNLSDFSFPVIKPDEVADQFHKSVVGRAAGYGVGALILWPLFIPAIVDGVGANKANKDLSADYSRKTLQDQIIKPYSIAQGLIFVPVESFTYDFNLTITQKNTKQDYIISTNNPELKIES